MLRVHMNIYVSALQITKEAYKRELHLYRDKYKCI